MQHPDRSYSAKPPTLNKRKACTLQVHQAIVFAIASKSLPFAWNFRNEDIFLAISFAKQIAFSHRLIRSCLFEIWWLKLAREFSGRIRVRIRIPRIRERIRVRIRIPSCIAATAVHSAPP